MQPVSEGWEVKRFLCEDELAAMSREQGEVATTIARMTQAQGCDQVVMGSHGRGVLEGLLLGSVATKVLHLVNVPVTLVK